MLSYLDNKQTREVIKDAIENVNYSLALYDALEEVNAMLERQFDAKDKDDK